MKGDANGSNHSYIITLTHVCMHHILLDIEVANSEQLRFKPEIVSRNVLIFIYVYNREMAIKNNQTTTHYL